MAIRKKSSASASEATIAALPAERQRALLEQMQLIRAFDEKVDKLYAKGAMHGTAHFCVGQEACAVGTLCHRQEGDVITGTHRGHGHAIAFGLDLYRMAAELLGRATGYCGGKGGSMHIADVEAGMLGANGIVGGSMGIACGAAFAFKQRAQDHVAICFFGDGAVQEGIFNETLNLASIWQLPVLFVCENNQYAMSLPSEKATAGGSIAGRAASYGMPAEAVDGMDLDAVFTTAARLLAGCRNNGPALIETATYRYLGHSKSDANRYRTREEIAQWRANDPIERYSRTLTERDVLDDARSAALAESAVEQVEQAFARAERDPEPELASALEDVYA
ncbi:MAG: thiamine pyrophosphate-dependent dehydrogenase E1 component subunit alpha [Salinisphaera sp.]|jgi:TPP-dependent pyruvate/acetoin dehydrogenase alpha subunit|nr:thiamine pyrophosphate-dependent dehydrogenase E1 component subunit alpha [Salinisphaera sp.]